MPSLQHSELQLPDALSKWTQEDETTLALRFPLHRSCRDGDLGTLSHLLSSASPQPDIFTALDPFCGWTPAIWAAFFGQLECLQRVTCAGPVLAARSATGMTALHAAALGNQPGCLHWLLKLGATHHLTVRDALGETALHKAARSHSHECSGLLAVCGADYSARNNSGFTPLQLADQANAKHDSDNKLPTDLQPSTCHVSSNGYYGYQSLPSHNSLPHKNGTSNGHCSEDMDSEDTPGISCECQPNCPGHTNGCINGHSNGHFNGQVNGCTNGHSNGFADMNIGRKRSMQDDTAPYMNGEAIKKMRHEEPVAVVSPPAAVCIPAPTVIPVRRCEIVYPRCMMGHYM